MESSMQTSLCQGLRACGLPKRMTHELLNTYVTWYDNNGAEWLNDRMKSIKNWYLTMLAGNPVPTPWMKRSKANLPLNVFGKLFRVRDQAKVLAALSANTLLIEKSLSPKQEEKFRKALKGNKEAVREVSKEDTRILAVQALHTKRRKVQEGKVASVSVPKLYPATPMDMTGLSIPIADGKTLRIRDMDTDVRAEDMRRALLESWRCVPHATIEYLDRLDRLDLIPSNYWPIGGAYTSYGPRYRAKQPVGRIGLIQQPCLKLRSVANPNRISQWATMPLAKVWEFGMMQFPSDCTFDQEAGWAWVQNKLSSGVELAGSDLSSATDLLDLDQCLTLANTWMTPFLRDDTQNLSRYTEAVRHFKSLSRGDWVFPAKEYQTVSWEQGQPLGLYPSFRLLAITNNALGVVAAIRSHLDPQDSFRVLGDDIIMDARMEDVYVDLVTQLGGTVNREKTLKSNKVAEFAGRIITPSRVMRKTYRYFDPGDTSFMSYVSDLGPQASSLLRPRQRKQWELFKWVPGIAFSGPWSADSFGEPLEDRVAWTLCSTTLMDEAPDPDKRYLSLEQQMLRLTWDAVNREGSSPEEIYADLPWSLDEDLQSSVIQAPTESVRSKSGDPRLKVNQGMTTLARLELESSKPTFTVYQPRRKAVIEKKVLHDHKLDQAKPKVPEPGKPATGSGRATDPLLGKSPLPKVEKRSLKRKSPKESPATGREPEKARMDAPPIRNRTELGSTSPSKPRRNCSDIDAALRNIESPGLEDQDPGLSL